MNSPQANCQPARFHGQFDIWSKSFGLLCVSVQFLPNSSLPKVSDKFRTCFSTLCRFWFIYFSFQSRKHCGSSETHFQCSTKSLQHRAAEPSAGWHPEGNSPWLPRESFGSNRQSRCHCSTRWVSEWACRNLKRGWSSLDWKMACKVHLTDHLSHLSRKKESHEIVSFLPKLAVLSHDWKSHLETILFIIFFHHKLNQRITLKKKKEKKKRKLTLKVHKTQQGLCKHGVQCKQVKFKGDQHLSLHLVL